MVSLKRALARIGFNLFPPYLGTGASIVFISPDWRHVRVKLPLSWRTRNIVGTTFGGSLYAAVDPVYMLMLMKILGQDYVVWDKAACIRFKKPGRDTLYADFHISDAEVETIKNELAQLPSLDRTYSVNIVDREGTVHALVEKTIYISRRDTVNGRRAA